jgi:hypothetical protein
MKANSYWMPMDESGRYWPKWADKWKTVVISELDTLVKTWRLQGIRVVQVEIAPIRRTAKKGKPHAQ